MPSMRAFPLRGLVSSLTLEVSRVFTAAGKMLKPHNGSELEELEEVEENILASASAEENNYDASRRNFEVARPNQYRRNPFPNREDQEAT
jgi:hypothetical protein